MFGDVGKPEAIKVVSAELTLDKIARRCHMGHSAEIWAPRESLNVRSLHEHLNRAVVDDDAQTHSQGRPYGYSSECV